jgi:hypothetical protein
MFLLLYSYALTITTYYDLIESKDSVLTFDDIMTMIKVIKESVLLYVSSRKEYYLSAFSMLYRSLHNVLAGHGVFAEESIWIVQSTNWWNKGKYDKILLAKAPFMVSFKLRYKFFQDYVMKDSSGCLYSPVRINVRREFLLHDAMKALTSDAKVKSLKLVSFINEFGIPESGVDGGGLFKEFIIELCKIVLDPKYGLFKEASNRELYPNPSSAITFGPDHLAAYCFIGKIVSKAIYESILIEPQFADFFLRKMLGKPIDYKDLQSLDEELYKHLITLRNTKDDVEDLALTFTTLDEHKV